MLTIIPLLSCVIFAAIYPLCFWISRREPLGQGFHKFHLALPNFIGGITVVALLFMKVDLFVKVVAVIWKISLLFFSYRYWKKGNVNYRLLLIPCSLGIYVFSLLQTAFIVWPLHDKGIDIHQEAIVVGILAGAILCASIYAMNLGHWYLNVHGLPISHLMRAAFVFAFFLGGRLMWDVWGLMGQKVLAQGELIPVYKFLMQLDGFFLWIAIFFGTLFPLVSLYFVYGTLKVKSTQSATGILYVILSSVFIGDITYKYYLFHYGIAL